MMIRAINCIFLIFALIFIFQKTEKEHYYNWDAIPYSMGLHIYEGRSVDEAHYLTFYNLREEVGPRLFQDLCCSGTYRSDQFSSSENLNSMLPMYVSKPGYISLISAVKNVFNISEYQAMKYISIYAVLLLSLLFFVSFFQASGIAQFAWIPLVIAGDILFLGKLMTPDAVTTLIFALGLVLLLSKRLISGYIVLALSMLFRLDMIVAVGLLGLLPLLNQKFIFAAVNSIVFLSIYFIVSSGSDHIGWWAHFYTSVISQQSNLTDFKPEFDFERYLSIVFGNLEWILRDTNYIKWFAMNLILFFTGAYFYQKKKNVFLNTVLMILCVSIIIKFFLFPKVDARIYLSILTPALFIAFFNLSYRKKVES